MKRFLKSGIIQKWKENRKRVLSLVLVFVLLAGYISWDNFGDVFAGEDTLEMPYELYPEFNVLPKSMSDSKYNYREEVDNAALCSHQWVSGNYNVWKGTGPNKLPSYYFQGEGSFAFNEKNFCYQISNIGDFTMKIKLGLAAEDTEHDYFADYSQLKQFTSRVIYKKNQIEDCYRYYVPDKKINKDDYGTKMTDWGNMNINSNLLYTISDIMVIVADHTMPNNSNWTVSNIDGTAAMWLSCGEWIRPANEAITKSQLSDMRIKVSLLPKLSPSAENMVYAYFEATEVDYEAGKIGFTAVSKDKLKNISEYCNMTAEEKAKVKGAEELGECEWAIKYIEDATTKNWYTLQMRWVDQYTHESRIVNSSAHSVQYPITDIAGNPVALAEKLDYTGKNFYLDVASPTITESVLTGSMIKTDASEDIAQADNFAGTGDTVSLSLTVSERVFLKQDASMDDIYLKWNVTDKNGNNVITKLNQIKTVNASVNTGTVSMLVFEPVSISAGMSGTVSPTGSLIGAEYLVDSSGNVLDGDLTAAYPDKQIAVDTQGPSITVGEVMLDNDRSDNTKKYYIVEFEISDGYEKDSNVPGAGLITSEGKNVTQYLSLTTYSSYYKIENLQWQYVVSADAEGVDFPLASEEGEGKAAFLGSNETGAFTVNGSGKYFLHLYLTTTEANKEISNSRKVYLDFQLCDAKNNKSNTSYAACIDNMGLDSKAPTVTVSPSLTKIERKSDTESLVTFQARVSASDTNGIKEFAYQWTDTDALATDNNWKTVDKTYISCPVTVNVSDGSVEKKLWLKAVDEVGNVVIYESTAGSYVANVKRLNPQYTITDHENKPGENNGVTISAPKSTDNSIGGYTRVIITLADGTTYAGVYNFTQENQDEAYSIFDMSKGSWYKVGIQYGKYTYVEEGTLDLSTYYNKMTIVVAASEKDLTPVKDANVTPDGIVDTTYMSGENFELIYTSKNDNVHFIILNGVMGSTGEKISLTQNKAEDYADYFNVGTSLAGVRYNFTIKNILLSELGTADVDFDNSYAFFVKTNSDGTLQKDKDGKIIENLAERITLAEGNEQSVAVPYRETDYGSGAYALVVHLAQKSGGVQDIMIEELLLVDNEQIPEYAGVSEYDKKVWVGYKASGDDCFDLGENIDITTDAITSINIGNAKTSTTPEIIYLDGKPAFTTSSTSATGYYSFSFTIRGERDEDAITTALGQSLGKIKGFRYWNQASSGDPTQIEWNSGRSNWYFDNGFSWMTVSPRVERGSTTIVDAATLAATDVSDFKLLEGHNVICWQMILENGKVSPVYTFEINLYDKLPEVEVSYEIGTHVESTDHMYSRQYIYPFKDETYKRIYADSYGMKVENASSENGDLTVYRASYKEGSYQTCYWDYEKVDAANVIPILADETDGYEGIFGTRPELGSTCYADVTEYYIFIDETGNARIVYPIISNEYSLANAVTSDGYWPVLVNENGREWAKEMSDDPDPKMYYFSKNPNMGTLTATEGYFEDDAVHVLYLGYDFRHNLEQISMKIDDRSEVLLEDLYGQVLGTNDAGIISYDDSSVYYVFPYDPNQPEGAEITHTVTLKGYINGELAVGGLGDQAVVTLEIVGKNIKPSITKVGNSAVGAVNVSANTYLYTEGIADTDYARDFVLKIYENGIHTQSFYDKYGECYELSLDITDMPDDPKITISSTELTPNPVEIVVESAGGNLNLKEGTNLPEGSAITGAGTSKLTIVLTDNDELEIVCTYDGATSVTIPVSVTNIYNKPIIPVVVWSYNEYKVNPEDNSYEGEVTATLIDANGSMLTDLATGTAPRYTFVPGGQTSYTFSNYVNIVGVVGKDITATLPVTLKTPVLENTQNDTYAPDVAITGYAKFKENVIDLNGAVIKKDTLRPGYGTKDEVVSLPNYSGIYGDAYIYESTAELMSQAVLAEKFIFKLDIGDENAVKIFLTADKYAKVPDYETGTSDTIEGVSVVGRTLQIAKNAEFVLHVVDSKGNATSFDFTVTNLGEEVPKPVVTQVLTKYGDEVRAYFTNPNLAGVTDLKITSAGAGTTGIETDVNSGFYGVPYMSFKENYPDGVTIFYSYKYNGMTMEGSVVLKVTELDSQVPVVTMTKWSANYDGTGIRTTNQDITVQFTFSKDLSDVYFADEEGNLIATPYGVSLVYLENRVTIVFEKNTDAMYLKVVEAANKNHTNLVVLPSITTIDKTQTHLSYREELSSNHRKAVVTFTSDKDVIWPNGKTGRTYAVTAAENGSISVSVADKAGNITKITAVITDIIEEDLKITLSYDAAGSQIIHPETDRVDIGDTIYVQTNRTSKVTLNENKNTTVTANAGNWIPLVITEDSEGLYPCIRAVDAFGNTAVVQLLQIPLKDRTKPKIILNKNLVSASIDATETEIKAILQSNYVASDNVTAAKDLVFSYELPTITSAGKYMVTYKVMDEAGNTAAASGWIRFYDGEEICVKLNGEVVQRDETIVVSAGTQTITITHNGEPYKVEWRSGIKSLGQMKNDTNVLTDYTEVREKSMTIDITKSGYYTFLVTTQGRDTYRFVIYVEE